MGNSSSSATADEQNKDIVVTTRTHSSPLDVRNDISIPRPDVTPDRNKSLATLSVGPQIVAREDQAAINKVIQNMEGLDIGQRRRRELSEQWKFYLGSEPFQRGIDAGLVLGGFAVVGMCFWPKNRVPQRLIPVWCAGFAIGMISYPLYIMYNEINNEARMMHREKTMFAKQRAEYLEKLKS